MEEKIIAYYEYLKGRKNKLNEWMKKDLLEGKNITKLNYLLTDLNYIIKNYEKLFFNDSEIGKVEELVEE